MTIPIALVGSIVLLLFLLRFLSLRLIPSGQGNTKEVLIEKTLTARTRIFFRSVTLLSHRLSLRPPSSTIPERSQFASLLLLS